MPQLRQRATSVGGRAEVSIMIVGAAQAPASRADLLGEREAVHLGHHGVDEHERERLARARAALAVPASAVGAAGDARRPHVPAAERSPTGSGGSWRCRRRPARAGPCRRAARPGQVAGRPRQAGRSKRAVKWNVLPSPGSLSTQMRPPISSTSSRGDGQPQAGAAELARASSRRPARRPGRSRSCFSGGMPMPVSRDGEVQTAPSRVFDAASIATSTTTSPCSVNLMALPTRLTSDLPQPARVADQRVGHARARCRQASSSPLLWAAHGQRSSAYRPERSRRSNVDGVEVELAGLDLGEVEDVVDHGQQRIGRLLDQRRGTRAARRSSSVSSTSSVMPMMPFIGVRISWLMLARNSLLARFACRPLPWPASAGPRLPSASRCRARSTGSGRGCP